MRGSVASVHSPCTAERHGRQKRTSELRQPGRLGIGPYGPENESGATRLVRGAPRKPNERAAPGRRYLARAIARARHAVRAAHRRFAQGVDATGRREAQRVFQGEGLRGGEVRLTRGCEGPRSPSPTKPFLLDRIARLIREA